MAGDDELTKLEQGTIDLFCNGLCAPAQLLELRNAAKAATGASAVIGTILGIGAATAAATMEMTNRAGEAVRDQIRETLLKTFHERSESPASDPEGTH